MLFEWDDDKRLANVQKHGVDFTDIPPVFDGDVLTVEDDRFDYDEPRFVTVGLLMGRVVTIVHTERNDVTCLISVRRATKYEERTCFEYFAH